MVDMGYIFTVYAKKYDLANLKGGFYYSLWVICCDCQSNLINPHIPDVLRQKHRVDFVLISL